VQFGWRRSAAPLFAALGAEATAPAALIEIVRGRLEGLGPMTAQAIAASLGLEVAAIDQALMATGRWKDLQCAGISRRERRG